MDWFNLFFHISIAISIASAGSLDSFRVSSQQIKREPACGETVKDLKDGDHGFIESPSYPNRYASGLDCEWRYESAPGTIFVATVFDMKTQNALLSDISDSLYVTTTGNWSDSQRFSGNLGPMTPMIFISDRNALALRFRSSRFTEGNKGFKIGYTVRNGGKPAVSAPAHDVSTVVLCNYAPVDTPCIWPDEGQSREAPPPVPTDGINRTYTNPFLVALVLDDSQFCSGTLISDRHILTSAHCTKGVRKIDMVFGTDNLSVNDKRVQKRQVDATAVTQHPNFNQYTGENDLSVIQLENPVEINRFTAPAALPMWSMLATTFTGFRGEIVGFGDSSTGTVYTQASRRIVQISPNAACSFKNRAHTGLSMCSRSSKGAVCQADSGSPIVTSRAYCGGPSCQGSSGNGINNSAQKPPRPHKPGKPSKPGRPNKPGKGRENDLEDNEPKKPAHLLLGLVSQGSCEKGFSFTRITSQLDFISKFVTIYDDSIN